MTGVSWRWRSDARLRRSRPPLAALSQSFFADPPRRPARVAASVSRLSIPCSAHHATTADTPAARGAGGALVASRASARTASPREPAGAERREWREKASARDPWARVNALQREDPIGDLALAGGATAQHDGRPCERERRREQVVGGTAGYCAQPKRPRSSRRAHDRGYLCGRLTREDPRRADPCVEQAVDPLLRVRRDHAELDESEQVVVDAAGEAADEEEAPLHQRPVCGAGISPDSRRLRRRQGWRRGPSAHSQRGSRGS
eukprot:3052038-Prymnesium_polylepis.2